MRRGIRRKYEESEESLRMTSMPRGGGGGGGRIRDVVSLIRRTDEPKIYIFFWGKKSKKTFSPEAKKIFLTTFLPDRVDRVKFQNVFSR